MDVQELLVIAAAVTALCGSFGAIAKAWKKAAKKIPEVIRLLDEIHDVLDSFIDENGNVVDLKKVTKETLTTMIEQLNDVIVQLDKLMQDC